MFSLLGEDAIINNVMNFQNGTPVEDGPMSLADRAEVKGGEQESLSEAPTELGLFENVTKKEEEAMGAAKRVITAEFQKAIEEIDAARLNIATGPENELARVTAVLEILKKAASSISERLQIENVFKDFAPGRAKWANRMAGFLDQVGNRAGYTSEVSFSTDETRAWGSELRDLINQITHLQEDIKKLKLNKRLSDDEARKREVEQNLREISSGVTSEGAPPTPATSVGGGDDGNGEIGRSTPFVRTR